MGRRAKKAAVVTKKKVKLQKRFKCPFCANEDVVECKMDFKAGIGALNCRLCGASYQMPIHHLHEPIDVFSEWLDDCEAAAANHSGGTALNVSTLYDDDDDDDVLPESSGMLAGGSGGIRIAHAKNAGNPKNDSRAASIDLGLDDSDDEEYD